jgi:hypothetical protein
VPIFSTMMNPSPALLVKLGSIIVHFDEATEPGAHEFDLHTARQLLADPEVAAWMKAMDAAA